MVGSKYDGLTNSYMTDEQRAALDPNSREYYNRIMGSKIQVAGWSLYVMVLWLIKGALAVFYSRLTYVACLPSTVFAGDERKLFVFQKNWIDTEILRSATEQV
jgi:hypothetical protein